MEFFNPYINAFKNYANFNDRTTVRGYWMYALVNFLVSLALSIIGIDILATVYSLAVLIPGLAITVRRLRDSGRNWPWIFISLVPLAGPIILIVFLCKASIPDDGVPVV